MIQRAPAASDPRLEAITRAIVSDLDPDRVILFGSRARGDAREDSDYDLIVELAHEESESRALASRGRSAVHAAAPDAECDLLVRQPGVIDARADDPGYVEWDVAREGRVLYARDGGDWTVRRAERRVRERGPFESIADWIALAEEDRRCVDNNFAAGPNAAWGAICFHSQQYAEKSLKALIVRAGVRPLRTHLLRELLQQARGAGWRLDGIDAACGVLTVYAVEVRYPPLPTLPSEAEARQAWMAAQGIVEAVRGELE